MKLNKTIISVIILLAGIVSCTDDWNDHYDSKNTADGSLWEAISGNQNLSNFAKVLQATGYDKILNSSQVFTVFAPTNDQFTESEADELIAEYNAEKNSGVADKKNSVLKEFVGNHISLFNYSFAESTDTVLNMLNTKNIELKNNEFGGSPILSRNDLKSNGVLYTIGGKADYDFNIFEYLDEDSELDSVRNYIYQFNLEQFVASESVPGEIINGKTHYVDSVTVTKNEIFSKWLNAELADEDSTYWFLAPTNSVWKSQLEKNETFFQYDKTVDYRDSLMYMYPRAMILMGTTFSKTFNEKMFADGTIAASDSALSTLWHPYAYRYMLYGSYDQKIYQYDDPFGSNGIFHNTTDVACSNGVVKKCSEWNLSRYNTFMREIIVEGESTTYLDSLNVKSSENKTGNTKDASGQRKTVASNNPYYDQVSNHKYLEIAPSGASNFTNAVFKVPDVLSNVAYDIYVVTVPGEAGLSSTFTPDSTEYLPVAFKACLQCNNANGDAYYIFKKTDGEFDYSTYPVYKNNNVKVGNWATVNSKVYVTGLTSTAGKVDSVYVGRYVFPTSSYNTSEPQVKIMFASTPLSSQNNKTYNRILRLDRIIFKPVDVE